MKKTFGNLYLFIAAMLCLFCIGFLTPDTSLKAHAAAKPTPEINYDKGSLTINISKGSMIIEEQALVTTLDYLVKSGVIQFKAIQAEDDYASYNFDLDNNGSMDMLFTYSKSNTHNKFELSALQTNSIAGKITLTLNDKAKENAKKTKQYYYNSLIFIFPNENVPAANSEPVKVENIATNVTIDDITYIIDKNGNATAIKIASKKKASINTIVANGKTYPVVAIADNACKNNKKIRSITIGANVVSIGKKAFYNCKNLKKVTIKANKNLKIGKSAFKKISKGATIKITNVKGSIRKKLIKSISK